MHTTKYIGATVMVVGLLLVGAACKKSTNENQNSSAVTNTTNTTTNRNTTTNSQDNQNTNTNRNTSTTNANVNRNTNASVDEVSEDVVITSPEKNATIVSPFTVTGQAPSGPIFVRVTNTSGREIFTVPGTSRNGAFSVNLTFDFTNTTSGKIQVYTKDADDEETNLSSVSVTFQVQTSENSNSNSSSNVNATDEDADDTGNSGDAY